MKRIPLGPSGRVALGYFGTHRDLELAEDIASREMVRLGGGLLPINRPARARVAELERGGLAA